MNTTDDFTRIAEAPHPRVWMHEALRQLRHLRDRAGWTAWIERNQDNMAELRRQDIGVANALNFAIDARFRALPSGDQP